MVRGGKGKERQGGKDTGLRAVPDRRPKRPQPHDFEEDPDRDPLNSFDDREDVVDDEYIWPTYEEDEDD